MAGAVPGVYTNGRPRRFPLPALCALVVVGIFVHGCRAGCDADKVDVFRNIRTAVADLSARGNVALSLKNEKAPYKGVALTSYLGTMIPEPDKGVDWRIVLKKLGCGSAKVLDQGRCGSCWAHAAASGLGQRLCLKTGGSARFPLSIQDIIEAYKYNSYQLSTAGYTSIRKLALESAPVEGRPEVFPPAFERKGNAEQVGGNFFVAGSLEDKYTGNEAAMNGAGPEECAPYVCSRRAPRPQAMGHLVSAMFDLARHRRAQAGPGASGADADERRADAEQLLRLTMRERTAAKRGEAAAAAAARAERAKHAEGMREKIDQRSGLPFARRGAAKYELHTSIVNNMGADKVMKPLEPYERRVYARGGGRAVASAGVFERKRVEAPQVLEQCLPAAAVHTQDGNPRTTPTVFTRATSDNVASEIRRHGPVVVWIGSHVLKGPTRRVVRPDGEAVEVTVTTGVQDGVGDGHAVLFVGYQEASPFGYFIIQNSWGSRAGDKGYFYVQKGTDQACAAECTLDFFDSYSRVMAAGSWVGQGIVGYKVSEKSMEYWLGTHGKCVARLAAGDAAVQPCPYGYYSGPRDCACVMTNVPFIARSAK